MDICAFEMCSGCGLCAEICPCNAIEMHRDGEGFLRPVIDSRCIECGACKRKCPAVSINRSEPFEKEAYAAYSKDKDIRKESSSGGVFAHIARNFVKKGGIAFGAGFGDALSVEHISVDCEDEIFRLMGSKYVQSKTLGVYKKIDEHLKNGKKVLFCGTPCQCAAVKNYVGNKEELFVIDIICHGVPSPALWEKYVKEEFPYGKKASFRSKKIGWEEYSLSIEGDKESYSCSQYKDPYLRMFGQSLILRPSCYSCSWKGESRCSDMTLADFWGISKVFPHMNDDKGTSAVIIRTEKGKRLFSAIMDELVFEKTSVDTVVGINKAYNNSTKKSPQRNNFFEDLRKDKSFKELSQKYAKPFSAVEILKMRTKRRIKKLIGKVYKLKNGKAR